MDSVDCLVRNEALVRLVVVAYSWCIREHIHDMLMLFYRAVQAQSPFFDNCKSSP